jgi:uncharacterized protein YndB with AHSA1/START domain
MVSKLKLKNIKQKVMIHGATPEEVYDALMDSKKHEEFTCSPAQIDPKVGGAVNAWDGYITGKNIELEYGKRIVQEWQTTEWPEGYPPSRLELNLKKVEGGTEIDMVQSGVPAEQAQMYDEGWYESYWDPLNEYFDKNQGKGSLCSP